ncbi:MAG: SoxR reducing system RseC family protein [Candidatus Accumulibacter sp. UW26]|jgi:sigma-E factor negative regulatory protein RseC
MTEAWGTVVAVYEQEATIRIDEGGCGRCHEAGGCGGAGHLFCATARTFRVPNPDRCAVGQRVRITVAQGSIGRSALHAYAFPLLALFAGVLLGSTLAGETGAISGAIGGLFIGWLGLRRAQRRSLHDPRLRPSIRP